MESVQTESKGFAVRTRTRVTAVAGGLGIVAILITLAFVFATSSGARQVADTARTLHEANAAAGSVALARAALAQATVFRIDYDLGVASKDAYEISLVAATQSLAEVSSWAETLESSGPTDTVAVGLREFDGIGSHVIEMLENGHAVQADQLRTSSLEPQYAALTVILATRQDATLDQIDRTENFAGVIGWLTSILATLLIPAAAIIVYFLIVRRQMREAKLTMQAQIEAEKELGRAKDDFIASISHELRTPLTSIYGFSEYLVLTDALDPEETVELVALIHEDSVELSRMIEDLLTAARVESDALKFTYDYVDLRVETLAATGAMTRSGTTVQVMGDVLCWADANRVRQIVRNLVSNAIKHGGPTVDVYLERDGDRAVLTVSDNGDVMDPEVEQRMFDRFVHDGVETLLTGSVGLGLSIARALARTMGGDIRFVRAGGWTNFEVSLPRKEGVPIDVPAAAQKPIVTDGPFAERVLATYT
jgi:signal transduction histidine kinase